MGKFGVFGKIWTPSIFDSLDPNESKNATKKQKSILAQKSYGSCFSDIPYHTINESTLFNIPMYVLKIQYDSSFFNLFM